MNKYTVTYKVKGKTAKFTKEVEATSIAAARDAVDSKMSKTLTVKKIWS